MAFKPSFTFEQEQEAKKLYSEFKNGHLVAQKMGFASTTIYNHLRLNLRRNSTWTDDEIQVLVDGYLEKEKVRDIAARLPGRTPRALMIRMCRYRKQVRKDPKKRRALSAISFALKAVRKADIFREMEV